MICIAHVAASAHGRNSQILLHKSSSTLLHIRRTATDRILVLIRLLRGITFLRMPAQEIPHCKPYTEHLRIGGQLGLL